MHWATHGHTAAEVIAERADAAKPFIGLQTTRPGGIVRKDGGGVAMQRYFQITPPSVHSMVLTLERRGFIQRVPGQARSFTLLVPPESLPPLNRIPR